MKIGRKLLIGVNFIVVLSTLLAYAAPYIHPSQFSYAAYFGLAFPILFFTNILFITYWLFADAIKILPSLITLIIGYKAVLGFINYKEPTIKNDSATFSVVSYNISNGLEAYSRESRAKKEKQKAMRAFIKRFKDEDIICLQEYGAYAHDIFQGDQDFKKWSIHRTNTWTAILTKHKIVDKGEIDFGTITNSCVWADIVVNFETLRVYSVHLQSNQISKDADDLVRSGDLYNKKGIPSVKGIFKKFGNHYVTRAGQVEKIKNHMNQSKYQVILCGDLNDTPLSYTYGTLSNSMKDLFYEKGKGFGTTYSGVIPLLRIDYILTDPCINTLSYKTIKEKYSDHYPVAALLYKNCNYTPANP
ncbi:MAG TPA: endonuclease/exonuclease/phosphatase family protein [Saprospiraceae bacterium]|nr:endonuclease/exonuclease/phosphatase family protein [Saprospiraceae bacterium]